MYFHKVRTVAIPLVADADPRSSEPNADQLFVMGKIDNPQGHALYVRFIDAGGAEVTAATANFTAWFKDPGSGKWISITPESTAPSGRVFSSSMHGTLFVQLTATANVGAATTVEVWAAELSAPPVT